MKHNLGRLLLFCVLFTFLKASDFTYSMQIDKPNPYIKEAVVLTVNVHQTNHDIVLLFDFDLVKSDAYSFQRIGIRESDAYHNAQIEYTYLIYPLKEGDVNLHFTLVQKATTDESIAYSFSGDRDNVKTLQTKDTKVPLTPLALQVKSLPAGTQIVGDFTLDYHIKTNTAKAYEPLPMQVSLKGTGYPPVLDELIHPSTRFTYFSETPLVKSTASKKGTHSEILYPLALSHDKSFTLDPIEIKAFNPEKKQTYTLTVPTQTFDISPIDKTKLLDKLDSPAPFKLDLSWLTSLLSYMLVFTAGFLSALSWKWQKKKVTENIDPMREKIMHTTTPKVLLQLLLSYNAQHFSSTIKTIEESLYGTKNTPFKTLQKSALEELNDK